MSSGYTDQLIEQDEKEPVLGVLLNNILSEMLWFGVLLGISVPVQFVLSLVLNVDMLDTSPAWVMGAGTTASILLISKFSTRIRNRLLPRKRYSD